MHFYRDHIYPRLVSILGNPKPIREVRQRIIPWAQGTVLEIGAGSGANFAHYDPAKVRKLYALVREVRIVACRGPSVVVHLNRLARLRPRYLVRESAGRSA